MNEKLGEWSLHVRQITWTRYNLLYLKYIHPISHANKDKYRTDEYRSKGKREAWQEPTGSDALSSTTSSQRSFIRFSISCSPSP